MYFQLTYLLLHYIVDSISAVVNKNRTITFTLYVCTTQNRLTGNTSLGEFTFPLDMFSSLKNSTVGNPFWVAKSTYTHVFNRIIALENVAGVTPEVFFASLPPGFIYLADNKVIYDKDSLALDPFEITKWNYELELEIIPEDEPAKEHFQESNAEVELAEQTKEQPKAQESNDDGWKPVSWLPQGSWCEKEEEQPLNITPEPQEVEEIIILDTSFATLEDEDQNTEPFQKLLLALKQGERIQVPYYIKDPLRKQPGYRTRRTV